MGSFTTLNLTGNRVLVKGTDDQGTTGETVLFAEEWNRVKAHRAHLQAEAEFENTVEEFFSPIMEAVEKFSTAGELEDVDPISYVVLHEGTEAVQGRDEHGIKLGRDSIVLRLLESGDTSRLVWVGGQLEVLAATNGSQPAAPSTGTDTGTSEVGSADVPEQRTGE